MSDKDKFLCSICLRFISAPTLFCLQCKTSWHQECIEEWRADPKHVCPICRSVSAPTKSGILDDLLDFLTEDAAWKCEHCNVKLEDRHKLAEHTALCPTLAAKAFRRAVEQAELIWKLAQQSESLSYMRIHLPKKKKLKTILVDVPDLRDKPDKLQFVLRIQSHAKKETHYRLTLSEDEEKKAKVHFAVIVECDKQPFVYAVSFAPPTTKLCDIVCTSGFILFWIYAF